MTGLVQMSVPSGKSRKWPTSKILSLVGKFVKIVKTLSYICGNEEIYDAMETDIEGPSGSDPHECKLREFKLKARYLLFCTSAKELPTKENLSKLIKAAMEEAGSVENIKLYCFLTPQQLGT